MRWFKRVYVSDSRNTNQQRCYWLPTMAKERPHLFSAAEHERLMEGYGEFQTLIKTTGNTSKAAKSRREGNIADKLNAQVVLVLGIFNQLLECMYI